MSKRNLRPGFKPFFTLYIPGEKYYYLVKYLNTFLSTMMRMDKRKNGIIPYFFCYFTFSINY